MALSRLPDSTANAEDRTAGILTKIRTVDLPNNPTNLTAAPFSLLDFGPLRGHFLSTSIF
jgi:hypothetical protein